MAIEAKRTIISTLDKKMATLEVKDWKINISYEGEAGKKINAVSVNGTKANNGGYLNYNLPEPKNTNISFNGADFDLEVVAAIYAEILDITKEI